MEIPPDFSFVSDDSDRRDDKNYCRIISLLIFWGGRRGDYIKCTRKHVLGALKKAKLTQIGNKNLSHSLLGLLYAPQSKLKSPPETEINKREKAIFL